MNQWNIVNVGTTCVKIYESISGKTIIMPLGEIMFRKDENDPTNKHFFVDGLNNNILEKINVDEMVSPPFSGTLDSFLDTLAPIAGSSGAIVPDSSKEDVINKDTDANFAANSDVKYPSQKAVKTAFSSKADLVLGKVPTTQLPDDIRMLCFSVESDLNLTSGVKNLLLVPYDCEIVGWDLIADATGDVTIDVWKSHLVMPTIADTITGTEKPELVSQQINADNNLTTWSTSLVVDDVLAFYIEAGSTVKKLTLKLKTIKN